MDKFLPVLAGLAVLGHAYGDTIEIFPGDSFEQAAESLAPGDTLIVHAGTYSDSGRVAISVKGTQAQPVIIQGADGEARPHITRPPGGTPQNTIDIVGATHLTIRGLEISSQPGGDGVNMSGGASFIVLEDLEIHDVSVGINFRSTMNNIIARGNHIHNTNGTGEGMYIGCHDGSCSVSDSLIEKNWIHDTRGSDQGDGIEVKKGSHSNVIRDNVVHDTKYPCILVYGTLGGSPNIVEGNAVWDCDDSGIQAAADAVIRNNLIFATGGNGFNSQSHNGVSPNNLQFLQNTVVGGSPCLRLNGWSNKTGMVFANNAVFCASGNFVINSLAGVTVSGNVVTPATGSLPGSGYVVGRSVNEDLVDAAQLNAYPTVDSTLRGVADSSHATSVDFNGTSRGFPTDAGAYHWTGDTNPGWTVGEGFKQADGQSPMPQVTLDASSESVAQGSTVELSWSSSNAVSCSASGAWSGSKALSGQETSPPIDAESTFNISCENAGQIAAASVTVTVESIVPAPTVSLSADPTSVAEQGSSTLSWVSSNADSCIGLGAWTGAKAANGEEFVGPLTSSSSFVLQCSNAGGTTEDSVTVTVQQGSQPAPSMTFSADPASVDVGGYTVLSWTSANANSCSASDGWQGNRPTDGSENAGPIDEDTTFSLMCTGAGGSLTRSVLVAANSTTPPDDGSDPNAGEPPPEEGGGGATGLIEFAVLSMLLITTAACRKYTKLKVHLV